MSEQEFPADLVERVAQALAAEAGHDNPAFVAPAFRAGARVALSAARAHLHGVVDRILADARKGGLVAGFEAAAQWHDDKAHEFRRLAVKARAGDNPLDWSRPFELEQARHQAHAVALRALSAAYVAGRE